VTTPQPRIDQTAVASMVMAVVGAVAWPLVGGWAALLAATVSLTLGFVALSRIKRNGLMGRWAAILGIGFGVVIYAILIVYIAWDLIEPIEVRQ
jgi:hypothetical protein